MRGHHIALVAAGVGLCAWCGWVSAYHRTTTPAEVTWVVSLGAVVAADVALSQGRKRARFGWHLEPVAEPWPRPGRGGPGRALRGVAPWLVLITVALAWDVLGIDTGPHQYHLTISALAQAYRPLNAGLLLFWMLVGVGYEAARARAPSSVPTDRATPVRSDPDAPASGAVLGAGLVNLGAHPTTPGLLLPSSPPVGVAFWVAVPCVALLLDLVATAIRRKGGERRGVRPLHLDGKDGERRPHRGVGLRRLPPVRALRVFVVAGGTGFLVWVGTARQFGSLATLGPVRRDPDWETGVETGMAGGDATDSLTRSEREPCRYSV